MISIAERNALAEQNGGLVWFVIRRHFAKHRKYLEDLSQEGHIALMQAAERFDPSKGHAFTTYAYSCIVGQLKHVLGSKAMRPIGASFSDFKRRSHGLFDITGPQFDDESANMRIDLPEVRKVLLENQYRALYLRAHGLMYKEIGKAMGISKTRAEQLTKKAITNARQIFGNAPANQKARKAYYRAKSQEERNGR